jgi:hypothetical protein
MHYCGMPSTKNCRDVEFFILIAVTSFWAADASQAFALSNAMMTNRLGGVPSLAVIWSERTMNFPPKTEGVAPRNLRQAP